MRLAREKIAALNAEGKQVKILCVGRKGYEQLRRQYEKLIVEVIELRGVKNVGFVNAEEIAKNIVTRFENGEFDVATLFFSRFKSVIAQIPTALPLLAVNILIIYWAAFQ